MSRLIDQVLLDALSNEAKTSPRRRKNRNFHAQEADASHRLLNALEPDSYIPPHRHLDPHKDESIIVLRGKLGAVFFDTDGKVIETTLLEPGGAVVGINVPHGTYHTLVALVADTVFFEAKAGPYLPLTVVEQASWAPRENDAGVDAYFRGLQALFDTALCT